MSTENKKLKGAPLSEEVPIERRKAAERAITGARVDFLFTQPFLGQIALRLRLVESSSWLSTAATDGRTLYYNTEFILGMDADRLRFLLAHEVLHVVLLHLVRVGHRDMKIANMAMDYQVNYICKLNNIGVMPEGGLYNEAYNDEMTFEEIYEILLSNTTEIEIDYEGFDEHLDLSGSGAASDDDGEGTGSGDGGGKKMKVRVMGKDGPPTMTDEELNKLKNEIKAAVVQAAQQAGAGGIPKGMKRLVASLTTPKLDWRSMLDAHIRSCLKDDYTFQRMSRRSQGNYILPGQTFAQKIDIAVAIDTSGSISDEDVRDFLSEVKGIMDAFPDFELNLWCFDSEVGAHKKFTPENLATIVEYEPEGGGGTTFEANWEFMREKSLLPARFVMFTDGCPSGGWGEPEYCPTLFVIKGNQSVVAPFGTTAHYEDAKMAKKAA